MTERRPVFDQINIVVRDMDASVAFYRHLGIDIPDRMPEWDPHHRSADLADGLDVDLDSVTFAQQWDTGWRGGSGCVLGCKLASRDDVDRTYADLTGAGHRGQQEPYDAFWGARYAIVEDPDGNAIGLMSPVDPARRTATAPPS